MGKFEELLDFINELNENGRIPYDASSIWLTSWAKRRMPLAQPKSILPPCCG